jgi:shikimate dehydrogenase
LTLLEQLGFAGLSVTMPCKQAVAGAAHRLHGAAAELRVVNTLLLGPGGRDGHCTDASAVETLLRDHRPRRALVLGRGGAARAAAYALQRLGCAVTMAARLDARGARDAPVSGVELVDWGSRADVEFDTLVNATPVGSDGLADPLPATLDWHGRVALDMVTLATETPLVRRVRAGGGQAFEGLEMWLHQGIEQLHLLTGETVTPAELRALCAER